LCLNRDHDRVRVAFHFDFDVDRIGVAARELPADLAQRRSQATHIERFVAESPDHATDLVDAGGDASDRSPQQQLRRLGRGGEVEAGRFQRERHSGERLFQRVVELARHALSLL
jgi:hypothetical protein